MVGWVEERCCEEEGVGGVIVMVVVVVVVMVMVMIM